MKRLTLNETWVLCLRMWKWIAGQKRKGNIKCVPILKEQWLKEHGFGRKKIRADCFFCEYAFQHREAFDTCKSCPGQIINPRFACGNTTYDYQLKPIAFYKKLVSLNKKRKKKKAKA